MTDIRAFIAASLPEETSKQLGSVIQSLRMELPTGIIRWVEFYKIHLTIKFLGEIEQSKLSNLIGSLDLELASTRQFDILIGGIGAFPSVNKPRVIWIGINFPPVLVEIWKGIENRLAVLDYPREKRPFSPHLTLGRVTKKATVRDYHTIAKVIENHSSVDLGKVTVNNIHLYKSELRKDGAVYSSLYSKELI